jgi:putative NADPH-quinone reductase
MKEYQDTVLTKRFAVGRENIQKLWTRKSFKSIITIDNKIKKTGNEFLKFILNKKKPKFFVTLHVRENGYRVNDYLSLDQSRNADLKKYEDSVNYIGTKNGYVFRLGNETKNKIKSNNYFQKYLPKHDLQMISNKLNCK